MKGEAQAEQARADDARRQADEAGRRAEAADRASRQKLYAAYLAEARAARTSGRAGQRFDALAAVRAVVAAVPADELSAEQRDELRDEAIAALALPDVREVSRRPLASSGWFEVDCDDRLEVWCFPDHAGRRTLVRRGDGPAVPVDPYPGDRPVSVGRKLSPDGRWLAEVVAAAGTLDPARTRVRIWDWAARRKVLDEPIPIVWAGHLAFHPTAAEALVSPADGAVWRIDLEAGKVSGRTDRVYRLSAPAYSPDGRLVALSWPGPNPKLLDAATLAPVRDLPRIDRPASIGWAPDGETVAVGTEDGQVYVWDRATGAGRFLPVGPRGWVSMATFSPDGRVLAVGGPGDLTQLWEWEGDRLLVTVPGRFVRFGVGPPGELTFAASDDHGTAVYTLDADGVVRTVRGGAEGAEFSPDGAYLVISGRATGVRFHAADTLAVRGDLRLDECGPVAFRPDGRELVTVGRYTHWWRWPVRADGGSVVVGPPVPAVPATLREGGILGRQHFGKPLHRGRHAAWSRDGRTLAVLDLADPRPVLLADPAGAAPPRVLATVAEPGRVAISPDGRWVAAGSETYGGTRVWPAAPPAPPPVLDLPDHRHAVYSPDGRWLAASHPGETRLYRPGDWDRPVRVIPQDGPAADNTAPAAFQPAGGLLAVGASGARVWLHHPETGAAAAVLTHPGAAPAVWLGWSPDGTRLAVVRERVEVAVWDLLAVADGLAGVGLPRDPFPGPNARRPTPAAEVRVDRGPDLVDRSVALDVMERQAAADVVRGDFFAVVRGLSETLGDTRPGDVRRRVRLLALRGRYNWQAGWVPDAVDDDRAALDLDPRSAEAAAGLARIHLLGPAEVRDPRAGYAAVAPLAGDPDAPADVRLLFAAAVVRLGRYREGLAGLPETTAGPVREYVRAVALLGLGDRPGAEAAFAVGRAAEARLPGGRRAEVEEAARLREEVADHLKKR